MIYIYMYVRFVYGKQTHTKNTYVKNAWAELCGPNTRVAQTRACSKSVKLSDVGSPTYIQFFTGLFLNRALLGGLKQTELQRLKNRGKRKDKNWKI